MTGFLQWEDSNTTALSNKSLFIYTVPNAKALNPNNCVCIEFILQLNYSLFTRHKRSLILADQFYTCTEAELSSLIRICITRAVLPLYELLLWILVHLAVGSEPAFWKHRNTQMLPPLSTAGFEIISQVRLAFFESSNIFDRLIFSISLFSSRFWWDMRCSLCYRILVFDLDFNILVISGRKIILWIGSNTDLVTYAFTTFTLVNVLKLVQLEIRHKMIGN